MTRRVLVTGATTPLGRALVRRLLDDPRTTHVLAVGREPRAFEAFERARLTYQSVDLTRERDVRSLLFGLARELQLDAVVHGAHHRAPDHDRAARRLDVESTRGLLRLAERHPTIERVVYRSHVDVYRVQADLPTLVSEDHPLDLSAAASERVRNHVEADLTACARMGLSRLSIAVLRLAEVLAPESGSQLWDYLSAPVCFRALGFDPMVNVLSVDDAARALALALDTTAQGVFNIPGADTLPLSEAIAATGRHGFAVPGALLDPLYALRRRLVDGAEFVAALNRGRMRFGAVPDGRRAKETLGYAPRTRVVWPSAGRW